MYLIGLLVVADVGLRIANVPPEYTPRTRPAQFSAVPDTNVVYVNAPATSIDFKYDGNPRGYFHDGNVVEHVTNRVGFRGPEINLAKDSNTFRVVFIGDSFTFGEGVYLEDTYPEQFRREATDAHAFGGRKIDVVNLGVGGYNTFQEWSLLADVGASLHPDAIVIGYVLNDAEPRLFTSDGRGGLARRPGAAANNLLFAEAPTPPAMARVSKLVQLIWAATQSDDRETITDSTIAYYRRLYQDSQPSWIRAQASLRQIGNFGRELKIPVVAVVFPALFDLRGDYPFDDLHTKIEQALDQAGIRTVQLLEDLEGKYDGPELWVHPTDRHPNEIVHHLAALALLESLSADTRELQK